MEIDSGRIAGTPTHRHFTIERMNALTDGVFAIVLTLLVLELKLPEKDESVLTLIGNDWHVFLAWLISFIRWEIRRISITTRSCSAPAVAACRSCNTRERSTTRLSRCERMFMILPIATSTNTGARAS